MDPLPTILDIEASGFGRGSYPIEIGFSDGQGGLFCSLIQPEADWLHWDDSAEALHGLSRELLLTHGRPARWILPAHIPVAIAQLQATPQTTPLRPQMQQRLQQLDFDSRSMSIGSGIHEPSLRG